MDGAWPNRRWLGNCPPAASPVNPLVSFQPLPELQKGTGCGIVIASTKSVMDADEAEVCEFLKSWPGQFVSAKEVCRRAGGKWHYREDERWALPVLQRLLEKGLVEADAGGHYRLITQHHKKNENKWSIWSRTQNRFLQSGGDYGVIDLDKDLGSEDCTASSGLSLSPHLGNDEQHPAVREGLSAEQTARFNRP